MRLRLKWLMLKALGATACALALFVAAPVSALIPPNEEAWTLDAPIPVSVTGASYSVDPIPGSEILNGIPTGINIGIECLSGTCDIQTQDWVVFRVTVLSVPIGGTLGELKMSLLPTIAGANSAVGMGYFLEGGPLQDGTGGQATYAGDVITDATLPQFLFTANGGGAGITGTTLALFVAYADGLLPQLSIFPPPFDGPGAANFMLAPFGSAAIGSNAGHFTTPIEVVPEPTTALLLGLGLAILGVRSRRAIGSA